jgi:3-phenylpropionate/trans-cinnamate dioxygenase ferredoxin reductase subunit
MNAAREAAPPDSVLIVGAGHAGGETAVALRIGGFGGLITLVGDEPHLPYQRPPLSKGFLAGHIAADKLYLRAEAAYRKSNISHIPGALVSSIDRRGKVATLRDGRELAYGKLVLATGGRPRRLAFADERLHAAANVHYLRTIADVERIRGQFIAAKRLIIIGGGYIGLEVAAIARQRNLEVTVLESMPRILARVTAPEVSAFYMEVHRSAGVNVLVGTQLGGFAFDALGRVTAVLAMDKILPADMVIIGIGLVPNVELAAEAGLAIDNGIAVNEFGHTSDPSIMAVGDCCSHPSSYAGRRIRLESVPNAVEQARSVAAVLIGGRKPYSSVPWFWSDQYDLKFQIVGLSEGYDAVVLRGSPENRSFLAFYLKAGAMIAADSVNRPQDFMMAKKLVAQRVVAAPARLSDESLPLGELLRPD